MAKNLLIVESPTKTRTLAGFLGKDFDILATVGHIIDLPKSKIGVDVDNAFEPQYEVIKGKEKIITQLRKAAKNAKHIYLAPDPDREGEAIAWHVAKTLKGKTKASLSRVTFNEITRSAVKEALENTREIDMNLVNAQQARRVLDRIVGYTVSPFLWKTIARNLSAGRVQSVALRLVCEREDDIEAFVSEEYWNLKALLVAGKKNEFSARLFKISELTVVKPGEKGKTKLVIGSQKEMDKYVKELKGCDFEVASEKTSERTRKPYAPFITSTLQQEAAKAFGFSPKVTMSVAQKLYEGIELDGKGVTGLITYMRTDSPRVSKEAIKSVRTYIGKEFGKQYLPKTPIPYGSKKRAQDAHEAIRPTYTDLSPDKVKKRLTPQQHKLYTLIWKRFVASQMNPAKFSVQTVDITAGRFTFRVTSQHPLFDGFLKVYQAEKESGENGNNVDATTLPPLKVGQKLILKKLDPVQSFTKPPPRFSEAMLVKELEADGIGRPSTYASIISTLKDRNYVELTERRLHPTDLGRTVSKVLVENLPKLFNVDFTAGMEKELDLIEDGTDDWVKVLTEFYNPFIKLIGKLKGKQGKIKEAITEKTDIACEKCGSHMVIKWGRNGRFLACSAYPDCRSTRPLPEEEARSKTDEKCEKCGSPMVIKTGRFGRFMACSAYPDCKNTKAVTLGVDCPKDGCGGKLVEKQTRTRRLFFGCSCYPKCDFASWDRPVSKACPTCNNSYMVLKVTKAKGEHLRCPECKHTMEPQTTEKTSAV
ncbi:MAG: type I DNA topoisomerase [Candidatus Zixiibacteriota bacterium]